jgi:hypothetical protein
MGSRLSVVQRRYCRGLRNANKHCFDGSQVCPACPSYNSGAKTKISTQVWSTEIERGTQLSRKEISQCHSVGQKYHRH